MGDETPAGIEWITAPMERPCEINGFVAARRAGLPPDAYFARPEDAATFVSSAKLLAALKAVEWAGTTIYFDVAYSACPSCRERERRGHAPGCSLAAALADAEGREVK